MTGKKAKKWIPTGEAARILGYCPDAFRRKFFECFKAAGEVMRLPGGHCRWLEEAVLRLRPSA